tara:strand:- start:194 stop:526 length:333 start_codon:yes stop_codon:yes gene_type:complete
LLAFVLSVGSKLNKMYKIKTSIKNNKLTIEIDPEWLEQESKNTDWDTTHEVGRVIRPFDAAEYLAKKLNEPTVDTGNGDVTPIAYMLMDALQQAYEDGEEFIEEFEDEEE